MDILSMGYGFAVSALFGYLFAVHWRGYARLAERTRCIEIVCNVHTRDPYATRQILADIESGKPAHRRKTFDVTHDEEDAPDGAEVDLPERGGWYRRVGDTWYPINHPRAGACACASCRTL